MKKLSKKYAESIKLVENGKEYDIKEALDIIEKMPKANFDETVELHVRLGVDSKHADQQVRGTVVLPNGTGKTQKVLVFAKGPKADEAQKAGADYVGAEELIPKIQNENWFDYDVVVATPDMMGVVGRLGKVLGPKGLMPNPKSGTVTMDVTKAINEIKNDAIREINGASLETIGDIISAQLGVQNNQVTFYVFQDKLSAQIEQCCEANANNVNLAAVKIEKAYSMQDAMLNDAMKYGVDQLKNLNITGEQIKAVRDVIAKGYKFKPWGAINMGKNITKWAGRIGAGIGVAFELYGWYKQHKDQKKLNELKKSLTNAINDCISNVFKTFESDNEYYKNFAPSYILLCQKIQERNEEIASLKQKVQYLENYKRDIEAWKNSAEYVDFEEV